MATAPLNDTLVNNRDLNAIDGPLLLVLRGRLARGLNCTAQDLVVTGNCGQSATVRYFLPILGSRLDPSSLSSGEGQRLVTRDLVSPLKRLAGS